MSLSKISSPLTPYLLVMVLLLPMFFIGIRDTHDWGDDFAIYLQGAENLIHHRPVSETKYVAFENYNHKYPPAAVPVGFPLLLTPVIKAFGINFKALNYYMSFWLYLLAIACFAFLCKYFSTLTSVCLTLIFFLNPFMIDFKWEVLSDVPFAFFSTLALLLYTARRNDKRIIQQILPGAVVAMLVSIRSIGWCTFLCFFLDLCYTFFIQLRENKNLSYSLFFLQSRGSWIIFFVIAYFALTLIGGHTGAASFHFTHPHIRAYMYGKC